MTNARDHVHGERASIWASNGENELGRLMACHTEGL